MTQSLRPARPHVPRDLLDRPALYARLDEWAPITVIRGASGYGKTTLVSAWLGHLPAEQIDVAWFSDDLGGAIREVEDRRVGRDPDRKAVLVVDGFEPSTDQAGLRRLVTLTARQPHLHLVLCAHGTRTDDSLLATQPVTTIEAAALLFTPSDIVALAALMQRPCTRERADRIHAASGGWPAVVKTILAGSAEDDVAFTAVATSLRSMARAELERDPAQRDIARLALAQQLEPALIADLDPNGGPDAVLGELEGSGLFSYTQIGEMTVLTYPQLVRDVLRDVLASLDPEGTRQFHQRLAAWYAEHEGPKHALFAFVHAVAAQEWDRAFELWDERAAAMVMDSLGDLIRAVLAIPAQLRDTNVSMRAALQIGDIFADGTDGPKLMTALLVYWQYSRAAVADELDSMSVPDLLFVGTGQLMALRLEGNLAASAEFADVVDARIRLRADTLPARYDRFCWFQLQAGITDSLWGADNARARYLSAYEHGARTGADFIPSNAAANLAMHHALRGESAAATKWLTARGRFHTEGQPVDFLAAVGAQVATGLAALDQLDQATVEAVLNIVGDGSWQLELWSFITYLAAQHALHFGDGVTMLSRITAIEEAHPTTKSSGVAAVLLARARADLLAAVGQGPRALAALHGVGADSSMLAVAAARVHLLAGDNVRARAIAGRLALAPSTCIRDRLDLSAISAVAALRMSDRSAAVDMFTLTVACSRESNNLRTLATIDRDDREALLGLVDSDLTIAEQDLIAGARPVFALPLTLISLTPREQALLQELHRTAVRRDIADALYVSINTVKSQLVALYHKLGTTTREETLMRAEELGLLS